MSSATISVNLVPAELLQLDGHCRPEIQAKVDEARMAAALAGRGIADHEALMIAKIIAVAKKEGKLTYIQTNIRTCPCCRRNDGYWPVRRRTKYKRVGQPDYDSPRIFRAFDLDSGFVTMRETIFTGFCESCADRVKPVLAELLANIDGDFPQAITGIPSRFKRFDNRLCTKCQWTGHEAQLGQLRTMMGDGYYFGKCPKCGAENSLFAHPIKGADGFALVPTGATP